MRNPLKDVPIYNDPEPHYVWEDLRLALGVNGYAKLEKYMESRSTLPYGPRVTDVEKFFNSNTLF
jgi:hypothetical protein